MRRFKRAQQTCEVALDGATVVTRIEDPEREPAVQRVSFRSAAAATWQYALQCLQRRRDGWLLIEQRSDSEPLVDDEFAAALRAAPDDDEIYLVYGDWLSSRGDPRGELIAVQAAIADAPPQSAERAALERRAMTLIYGHRNLFLGEGADIITRADFHRFGADALRIDWHLGFARGARLDLDNWSLSDLSVVVMLRSFLDNPSARALRRLEVDLGNELASSEYAVGFERGLAYAALIDVIAGADLPLLSALSIGRPVDYALRVVEYFDEDGVEHSYCSPALTIPAALWAALPALRELALHGETIALAEPIDVSEIRTLAITTMEAPDALLAQLCAASWPALERLTLHADVPRRERPYRAERLAALVSGERAPRLTHLALRGTADTDWLVSTLATSALAAQLVELDIGYGTLTASGATALASPVFRQLASLRVRGNELPAAARAELSRRGVTIHVGAR